MRILIIIPAFNEQATIAQVIQDIKHYLPEAHILVVNDGSKDNTALEATKAGAEVLNLPFNLGIGGAMQTGFKYALNHGYDIAVQVDADGQHDPAYIKTVLAPIMDNTADMVIGSRYIEKTSYKSSLPRRIGMISLASLIYLLTKQKLKDTTSGFRAINKNLIKYFTKYYPVDYPEVEILVRVFKRNFRVIEVPVEMKERLVGKSSINFRRSIYYMIKVGLAIIFDSSNGSTKGGDFDLWE